MSWIEWLAGHILYPCHEALRRRATLRELRELRRIARLPPATVNQIVEERLGRLLKFAQRELPFYADQFAQAGVNPATDRPYEVLRRLPVLTKAAVRANQARMIHARVPGGLQPAVSGGTSGDTLHFYIDRLRQAQTMAARLFFQDQFGVRPGDRRVHLWGSPLELKRSRTRQLRDRLLNEVLLDAFDMSPAQMDAYAARLRRFQPRLIYAYPRAIHLLARHLAGRAKTGDFSKGRTRPFPFLRLIVVTGDEIEPQQRETIRSVFGCPVAAEYGSREVGLIAHECPHHALHVVTPHVWVEVLPLRGASNPPATPDEAELPSATADGAGAGIACRRPRLGTAGDGSIMVARTADASPAADSRIDGGPGSIICTNLNTRAQPLIRYQLGDVGALLPGDCPCRLPFPMLELTGARITGFVAMPDGTLRHGHLVAYLVRAEPCVVEFKVYQRELDLFDCYLVVDERCTAAALARITRSFRTYFGQHVRVNCRLVPRIPPDPSGKRRHVISEVAARLEQQHSGAGRDAALWHGISPGRSS